MATKRRKSGARRPDVTAAEILGFELGNSSVISDPGHAAAIQVLTRALAAARIEIADHSGILVLDVPDTSWVDPLAEAFVELATTAKAIEKKEAPTKQEGWVVLRGTRKQQHSFHEERAEERVWEALQQERNLVGISHEPDRDLPRDLVRAADHRLVIEPLTSDDLAEVTQAITGELPTLLPDAAICALVTPRTLRLARRRRQRADDFIDRLARLVDAPVPRPSQAERTLDSLPGMDDAVSWGRSLARDIEAYSAGRLDWADVDRGCLLVGPPGVGKTTYACALAATCGTPLISASYSRWQSSKAGHLGDLLKAMAASFDQARKAAPCILFIDELDAFFDRAGPSTNRDWWTSVVGALLEHLDGIESREGVVVIGATNHPDMVDPAIIRSGRLDRTIVIPMPNQEALAKILRVHLGSDLSEVDLSLAATHALGGTGADCEKWVRGARRRARNARRPMTLDDLMQEIRGEGQEAFADHRKIYAVHEAGHALLRALEQPGALRLASIRQSADEGGRVVAEVTRGPITQASINVQLRQLLAGRAAEDVVLGQVTGGAGGPIDSDLAKATRIALDAETALGLSERPLVWLGMWRGNEMSSLLLDRPELAQRVERRLQAAYSGACDLIREHRALLDVIVNQLLEREVLTGADVEAIVKAGGRVAVTAPPQAAAGPP